MQPAFKFNRPQKDNMDPLVSSSSSSSSSLTSLSERSCPAGSHVARNLVANAPGKKTLVKNNNGAVNSIDDDDIHPIELVIQDIVGPSLDSMESNLSSLQDSQYILLGRLHILEKKLTEFDENVSVINTNDLLTRITSLKTKLAKIVTVLEVVQKRLATLDK